MDKTHIVRFLKEKKRGVYTLIVQLYSETILSMATTMALTIIQEDLTKISNEPVELNYFSLHQAIVKYKKNVSGGQPVKKSWRFEDDHESKPIIPKPGTFKID